jgi:hypothetical protein
MTEYLKYKLAMWRWWWSIPTWYEWRHKRQVSMDTWHILNERWWARMPLPPAGKEHWNKYPDLSQDQVSRTRAIVETDREVTNG